MRPQPNALALAEQSQTPDWVGQATEWTGIKHFPCSGSCAALDYYPNATVAPYGLDRGDSREEVLMKIKKEIKARVSYVCILYSETSWNTPTKIFPIDIF